jgi:hypothetical protein
MPSIIGIGARQRGLRICFDSARDGRLSAFDGRSHHRALTRVLTAAFFALSRAFASGCAIGQADLLEGSGKNEAR